jgi:hypothetical protein
LNKTLSVLLQFPASQTTNRKYPEILTLNYVFFLPRNVHPDFSSSKLHYIN